MANRLLVDSLVAQVRSLTDENNTSQISTEDDIIPALNRAQDHAASILARKYESPMLTSQMVTLTGGVSTYDTPENAFEERLEKVEVFGNNTYYEVQRIDYRDISNYETATQVMAPGYYCIIGKQYRLIPTPAGTYNLRIWFLQDPPPLALSQGRITVVNTASRYVVVDSPGSSLEVENDSLNSLVNVVDGQTGSIKATLQIQSITGGRITFKSTPSQATIENYPIVGELPTTVAVGDYLTVAPASCISFFRKPFSNFLVAYAAADIQRKLGNPSENEARLLESLQKDVERSWAGREQSLRVKHRQGKWAPTRRRVLINI